MIAHGGCDKFGEGWQMSLLTNSFAAAETALILNEAV